jgi:hypothetical protein
MSLSLTSLSPTLASSSLTALSSLLEHSAVSFQLTILSSTTSSGPASLLVIYLDLSAEQHGDEGSLPAEMAADAKEDVYGKGVVS